MNTKFTYAEIDQERVRIIHQAFEDQQANIGNRYYHVDMFHKFVEKIYQQGFEDGTRTKSPAIPNLRQENKRT